MRRAAAAGILLSIALAGAAPGADVPIVPPLREQHRVRQEWLKARLDRVLPALMRRHGIAMWIISNREYAEDPVFLSLVSPSVFAARRRTILVFFDRGPEKGIERLALGGGSNGGLYTVYRDPAVESRELWGQGQWALLRKVVDDRKPSTIALNISHTHAFADGLSAGEREQIEAALGPWTSRIVRAENLPLEYLAIRVPEMLPVYRDLMRISHSLIARAFSNEVIKPGKTTTADVEWWMRQRVNDLGLGEWFPPTVTVQRRGLRPEAVVAARSDVVIERGDHLHVDFGIQAVGLATDTQHVGYVLRDREKAPPAGLVKALEASNRLQDLLMERLRPGRAGNEILADTLGAMKKAGLTGTVYTHPIGDHGHGAGPLIGLWDRQEGVPGRGDVLVHPSTWFSIELEATTPIPEWNGQALRSAQEEDAFVDENGRIGWVLERQTKYHLVR
ncbi:MAG: aminopeptidase P family protein [Acidobacteriota bacterium]|nr:aminopeptidase P family protein [Acidobacteriota bacterium]MDQ5871824.1 aminopeptidase P family protein [Acidobacteriota bacterium]